MWEKTEYILFKYYGHESSFFLLTSKWVSMKLRLLFTKFVGSPCVNRIDFKINKFKENMLIMISKMSV